MSVLIAAGFKVHPFQHFSCKEIKPGLDRLGFHIGNIVKRVKQNGDLLAPVLEPGVNLKKCLQQLDIE